MKKIKHITLKLGFFLIITFFLALFTATFLSYFYESAFIFDNYFLIESITFGIGTFLTGLYLIFFDFSEKSLKTSIKKANVRFVRFWKNMFILPYKFFKNKPILFIKILIFITASILTYKFTYNVYDMIYWFERWDWGFSEALFRSLFVYLIWAVIKILIIWFAAISLIMIIGQNDK
ncbi:MAG: hypothetical protein RBS77_03805 [Candidatus Moranbacteria bacterium]|jgi:hypothetical protein|nr:hypothetical protein [Candidatus Moranbacteria bacterium]